MILPPQQLSYVSCFSKEEFIIPLPPPHHAQNF